MRLKDEAKRSHPDPQHGSTGRNGSAQVGEVRSREKSGRPVSPAPEPSCSESVTAGLPVMLQHRPLAEVFGVEWADEGSRDGLRMGVFRFERRIFESGDCHAYVGSATAQGYGRVYFWPGRFELAHRLAYRLYRDDIPEGWVVDHLCCNRRCCRPEHLEAVTLAENSRRGNRNRAENAGRGRMSRTKREARLEKENRLLRQQLNRALGGASELRVDHVIGALAGRAGGLSHLQLDDAGGPFGVGLPVDRAPYGDGDRAVGALPVDGDGALVGRSAALVDAVGRRGAIGGAGNSLADCAAVAGAGIEADHVAAHSLLTLDGAAPGNEGGQRKRGEQGDSHVPILHDSSATAEQVGR